MNGYSKDGANMEYKGSRGDVDKILSNLVKARGTNILHKVTYPRDRSVDHIIEHKNCKTLLKFADNISSRGRLYQELKKLSKELNVNSLIVANKLNDEMLMHEVLYIRGRLGLVSTYTIKHYAAGDKVFVYEYNGMLYVKIDGKKLKALREQKGFRIHELANAVGVSAKALKDYEDDKMDMTVERAYRFLEIFGNEFEDVIEEVDIFRDRIIQKETEDHSYNIKVSTDKRAKIVDRLRSYGLKANIYNSIPSDIITSDENIRFFISYIERSLSEDDIKSKCENNYFFAKTFKGMPVVVVDDDIDRNRISSIEEYGYVSKVSNIGQLAREIVEETKR
ncbi:MAG: helix-turn-helix domain-containing protein [Ignisphaera sp.]